MWGNNYNNNAGGMGERATDNFIQQNVPGGLNSPMGEQLDNMLGGNPNPTQGQIYGGAPGVGGQGGFPSGNQQYQQRGW
ncbi:hypothetical protein I4U23_023350 [Adineta vaga]|nr:hypothetical protein I4U23_023350 [Adineta vaga]